MSRRTLLLILVVLLGGRLLGAAAEEPSELERVLASMQKAADGVKDLEAEFIYLRYLADFEDESRKSGRLRFRKPEFLRIDFTKPYEKTIYVTPERFVEYRPDTDVATIVRRDRPQARSTSSELREDTLAIALATSPRRLAERFHLALIPAPDPAERRRFVVLELRPKGGDSSPEGPGGLPPEVLKVWLWVDRGDWLPRRVKSFERDGDTETFVFSHVKTNLELRKQVFEFTPGPKTVIDDLSVRPPAPSAGGGRQRR